VVNNYFVNAITFFFFFFFFLGYFLLLICCLLFFFVFFYFLLFFFLQEISGGDVLVVIMAVMIASFMLGTAASHLEAIATGYSSASTFFGILERTPQIDISSTSGKTLASFEGNLRLTNALFR
jgi:ABC-type multidrug transport system fused ATPase/permease subunit